MERIKIFDSVAVAAGASVENSDPINLDCGARFVSIELHVTGDGTIRADYLGSISELPDTWKIPEEEEPILSGVTSATNTNGVVIKQFYFHMVKSIIIRLTEIGLTDGCTCSAWLLRQ